MWPSSSTPRCIPMGMENIHPHKNLYTNVLSSVIHNGQKQLKCPCTDGWKAKCGVPYNGIIALQWGVVRPLKGTKPWHVLPRGCTLKISHWAKAAKHESHIMVWFHLYEMPRTGKSIETESRQVSGFQGLGKGWMGGTAHRGVSFSR